MEATTNFQASFKEKHPVLRDVLSLVSFVLIVTVGTFVLNSYVFRSYNVVGRSMENTMHDGDRLIVNRLAVSIAHFKGEEYVPERGQIIVFANGPTSGSLTCGPQSDIVDQYVIKRVIAFPGERVTVKDGVLKVYNDEWTDGYEVDEMWRDLDNGVGPKLDVYGEVDLTVPKGELFVAGDNREGTNSKDSRSGLGTIPFCRVVGPVLFRMYPFDKISAF